jgi:glycosyltransferase involved in cell wall biosynthesis
MAQVKNPLVSIIIPAYNEEKNIVRLLKSVTAQDYRNIESIVVDDGSSDSTTKLASKYGAKVFKRKHAERSIQRNFGAESSHGKYLLFLDADMELTRNVVGQCVDVAQSDKNIGAVVIPERSIATNFWEKVKAFERSLYNKEGDEAIDAARFVDRRAFNKAGGYDESITGPEDWDLPESVKRCGYRISRIKACINHYEHIPSIFSLARKKYYYALSTHRYLKKQKISMVSTKTVFFLRPVFYRNWRELILHPLVTTAMLIMLTLEMFAGGAGFVVGRMLNK